MSAIRPNQVFQFLGWLGLIVLVAYAFALRFPGLADGYTSDETSLVLPFSLTEILWSRESAVNPPWYSIAFNQLFDSHRVVLWARRCSLLFSVSTVALVVWTGRALSGGRWSAGLAAGTLLTLHPWSIDHATVYRVYALTCFVAALHFFFLVRATTDEESSRSKAGVWITAIALPQLHYFWAPILALLGLAIWATRYKKLAWAHLCAVLGVLPWVVFMLYLPDSQNPADAIDRFQSFFMMIAAGTRNGHVLNTVIVLGGLLCFRRLEAPGRWLYSVCVTMPLVTLMIGQFQLVRDPVSTFMVLVLALFFASLLAPLPTTGRTQWIAPLCAFLAFFAFAQQYRVDREFHVPPHSAHNSVLHFQAQLPHLLDQFESEQIVIHPEYYLPVLHLYLTGTPIADALYPCETGAHCFIHDGRRYTGRLQDAHLARSLILSVAWDLPAVHSSCVSKRSQPAYSLWFCAGAPAEPDTSAPYIQPKR